MRLVVGLVRRPHGVRGEVLVEPLSEVPGRLARGARVLAASPAAPQELEILNVRPQGEQVLVAFAGFESREQAEILRGVPLEIEVEVIPPAPKGRYWIHQLIGCRCEDELLGELGEVVDVIEDGGGELLVVRDSLRELLVPFVTALVPEVDVDARRIRTQLPEGFVEACGSVP